MSINFEEFESYLEARHKRKKFIHANDNINRDEIKRILMLSEKYGKSEIGQCISTSIENGFSGKLYVDMFCSCCNKYKWEKISKSEFLRYLKCGVYVCTECEKELIESQKDSDLDEQDETEYYINTYLNPKIHWGSDIKYYHKESILKSHIIDMKKIEDYIKSMKYRDFLKTPYWTAIADCKKYRANLSCQLCGSNDRLAVHHKTYNHHGRELYHMDDLIVLCKNCHSKFHDKVGD